jgi:P-type Ca2+ transporter type 2C
LSTAGYNVLPTLAGRSRLSLLAEQFQSLPVALLAGAAVISVASGALLEAAAIAGVVLANAAIGYRTEDRAERVIQSLAASGPEHGAGHARRRTEEIPAEVIVPGDLLLLQRGMIVPADARLTSVRELTVSEASLTGESRPVAKSVQALEDPVPLSGRTCMVYRGTIVTGGSATAIVVATGAATEAGRIARLVGSAEPPETPMQQQLADLGRQLVWPTLAACGLIMGLGWLRGFALLQMARSALATAVAAVPEGLPMVATTTLAFGVEELQKHDIHVRRLHAVEALAAVQVICFDKTGTLTVGRMSVTTVATGEHVHQIGGRRLGLATMSASTDCSPSAACAARSRSQSRMDAWSSTGPPPRAHWCMRPRSTASTSWAAAEVRTPVDPAPLRVLPVHGDQPCGRGLLLAVKGSPAEVLERCRWEMTAGRRAAPPDGGPSGRDREPERRDGQPGAAGPGLRLPRGGSRAGRREPAIEDLTWVGLAGMADPIRPAVHELMEQLHQAGVQTIMLTGDQSATARAVAERVGLNGAGDIAVIDAAELDTMHPAELAAAATSAHAFSRVSPAQKLQIVRAFRTPAASSR